MLYPLIFEPIYKEMVWGSESWDISCREQEMGIIKNGIYRGERFGAVIGRDPKKYLGRHLAGPAEFPLLIKLIKTFDDLSVQVHPTDAYAREKENLQNGKTEMWHILEAPPNGKLIIGLKKGVTKESFRRALEAGDPLHCLSYLPIKPGDVIPIPAGLVHAITAGVVLVEVQQNSNTTYRVFDYNRPRQLHIDKALDVIDFDDKLKKSTVTGLEVELGENRCIYYIASPYFAVLKYKIKSMLAEQSDANKFFTYTCVKGSCQLQWGSSTLNIQTGDSFFVPAAMGNFIIHGECELLKSFVPDVKGDFIKPLLEAGHSLADIQKKGAFL